MAYGKCWDSGCLGVGTVKFTNRGRVNGKRMIGFPVILVVFCSPDLPDRAA